MKYFLIPILFLFFLIPSTFVSAQGDFDSGLDANSQVAAGLVTCDGVTIECTFCTLVSTVDKVIDWLFGMLSILAVLMMVVAGFKLVTAGGDVSAVQSAKSMFSSVVIGIVIVLAAWLIVDTLMKALIAEDSGFGPWNTFDSSNCVGAKPPTPATTDLDLPGGP